MYLNRDSKYMYPIYNLSDIPDRFYVEYTQIYQKEYNIIVDYFYKLFYNNCNKLTFEFFFSKDLDINHNLTYCTRITDLVIKFNNISFLCSFNVYIQQDINNDKQYFEIIQKNFYNVDVDILNKYIYIEYFVITFKNKKNNYLYIINKKS